MSLDSEKTLKEEKKIYEDINYGFTLIFVIEALLKIYGNGI